MDLLGSILGNMTKPPSMSEKEKEKRKKQREMAKKLEEKHKEDTKKFREKIEKQISNFVTSSENTERKLIFPPMEKYQRSLIHDIAEVAGLVTHSFGEEDIDRHIVVWKKEFSPCDDELECMKSGITEFDPVEWTRMKVEKQKRLREEEEEERKKDKNFVPSGANYQEKYEHLIGKDSALEAARKTEMNKSYGMVSAESKKDKRTVEDIQAEIRAKKKRKLEEEQQQQ